jgi:translation initiation factor 5
VIGSSLTTPSKGGKKGNKKGGGSEDKRSNSSDDQDEGGHSPKVMDDDDDDWAVDVSVEAVKKRMADLSAGVKNLAVDDDLEKTEKERADMLYNFIKARKDGGQLAVNLNVSASGIDKEIVTEAERLDVRDKAPLILAEVLFDAGILSQVRSTTFHKYIR